MISRLLGLFNAKFMHDFGCTQVSLTSDSVRLVFWWDGGGLVLWLLSVPLGFACWISFAPVFGFLCSWVLVFASSPLSILVCVFQGGGWMGVGWVFRAG